MKKTLLLIILLFLSCSNTSITNKSSNCQKNGTIDFLYINIPCNDCIQFIEQIIGSNNSIFDYNVIANKEKHILINYCYDYNSTTEFLIEKMFTDYGFVINQEMTEQQMTVLENLCCTK